MCNFPGESEPYHFQFYSDTPAPNPTLPTQFCHPYVTGIETYFAQQTLHIGVRR